MYLFMCNLSPDALSLITSTKIRIRDKKKKTLHILVNNNASNLSALAKCSPTLAKLLGKNDVKNKI